MPIPRRPIHRRVFNKLISGTNRVIGPFVRNGKRKRQK